MVRDDFKDDDTEYQLNDEEETVYEPEEEQFTETKPKKEVKQPPKKNIIVSIIILIVVIVIAYKGIGYLFGAKYKKVPVTPKKVLPVKVVQAPPPKATMPVITKPVPTKKISAIPEDSKLSMDLQSQAEKIATLQKTATELSSNLQQQHNINQQRLNTIEQKMSNLNDRMVMVQNASQNLTNQLQKMQYERQQVRRAAIARKAKIERMRIRSIRQAKNYYVQAVVPGRAWLRGEDGSAITITVGSAIPGYGRVVSIDPYSGNVKMSSGVILRYAVSDD